MILRLYYKSWSKEFPFMFAGIGKSFPTKFFKGLVICVYALPSVNMAKTPDFMPHLVEIVSNHGHRSGSEAKLTGFYQCNAPGSCFGIGISLGSSLIFITRCIKNDQFEYIFRAFGLRNIFLLM